MSCNNESIFRKDARGFGALRYSICDIEIPRIHVFVIVIALMTEPHHFSVWIFYVHQVLLSFGVLGLIARICEV
jgi:hypothetical protein